MDILARIKQLALERRLAFTKKVDNKLEKIPLTREFVREAIVNAPTIFKTVRSKNPRRGTIETLYVIKGMAFDGQFIEAKVRIDYNASLAKKIFSIYMRWTQLKNFDIPIGKRIESL